MHWKKLISYVRYLPEMAGVEVHLQPGQKTRIRLAKLRRKGQRVSYTGGEYDITTWAKVADKIPRDMPLSVFLDGTGVIHRLVAAREDTAEKAGWMTQTDSPDLYQQQTPLGDGRTLCSYIKRTEVERVLGAFRKAGLEVVSLSLGPFAVLPLLPHIRIGDGDAADGDTAEISFGRHIFQMEEGKCQGYTTMPTEKGAYNKIRMGGEEIDERLFPAFAQAFCLISDIPLPELELPALRERMEEHREKGQFKRTVWVVLGFFLTVLLINAWVFLSIAQKLSNQAPTDLLQQKAEVERLRESLQGQEKVWQVVQPSGDGKPLSLGAVADQLAAVLPDAILLETLTVYPKTTTATGHGQPPRYAFDQITIRGESKEMQAIQDWLKAIGQMPFCQRVQLDRYQVQKDGTGVFDLMIQLF